jgi:hypothetical protein
MMGWDLNLIENQTGNKATYKYMVDGKQEEIQLSDEYVRMELAKEAANK